MLVDLSRCHITALGLLLGAVFLVLGGGCQDQPKVRLVPIFPVDEPTLLTAADITRLYVTAEPVGATAEEVDAPVQTSVERNEAFSLSLAKGTWKVKVRGVDGTDSELVYGETRPFEVRPGKSETVRFFLGRTMAFNLVELSPPEVADSLTNLIDHTATAFTDDDGRPFVLVAGGRRANQTDDSAIAQALLIDAASHTVELLPALSCARAGHRAFVVQTSVGKRVVIAGGDADDGCASTLDVYDPYSQSFEKLEACGLDNTRGAVPELASIGAQAEQSGRVLVAGDPHCVVDLVNGTGTPGLDVSAGPAPVGVVAAGQNALLGQQLIVTPERLFVDRALEGATCVLSSGAFDAEAVWEWDDLRVGGRLASINPLKTGGFLLVGGQQPDGSPPSYDWSYVVINDCEVSQVTEGAPVTGTDARPSTGFALVDLEAATGEDINMLVTGGYLGNDPLDRVALFHKPANSNIPTWHNLSLDSRQTPLRLKKARGGHAAALLDDGSYWIVGGGSALCEIFIKGAGGLAAEIKTLDRRNPTLSSMAVIDTAEPPAVDGGVPEPSMADDFAEAYPEAIYDVAASMTAAIFLASTADRAVTDGLLDAELANPQGCSDPPGTIGGVVSGNVDISGFDEDTVAEGEWGSGGNVEDTKEIAKNVLAGIADEENGCAWRQLVRVGLNGLTSAAEDAASDGLDLQLGINVLALVTADDDCSQGVYEGLSDQLKPSDSILENHHCTTEVEGPMAAFDEYFGLPPVTEPWDVLFEGRLDELAWAKRDLIVVLVGNTTDEGLCAGGAYGGLRRPRRLLETLDAIEQIGAQTIEVDLCGATGTETLTDQLGELVNKVSDRNPYQACIPGEVAGVDPPYDEEMQQYEPVEAEDVQSQQVAAAVAERCELVYREDHGGKHYEAVTVADDRWQIGTNYDGRVTGCLGDLNEHLGWVLQAGLTGTGEEIEVDWDRTELICVP